jgi:hypothetical protein
VKLNKKPLPREKSTKEEMLLAPESGLRHNSDFKNWQNEVRELRSGLGLIDSTAHSHTSATRASMSGILDPQNSCEFNHKISWKS